MWDFLQRYIIDPAIYVVVVLYIPVFGRNTCDAFVSCMVARKYGSYQIAGEIFAAQSFIKVICLDVPERHIYSPNLNEYRKAKRWAAVFHIDILITLPILLRLIILNWGKADCNIIPFFFLAGSKAILFEVPIILYLIFGLGEQVDFPDANKLSRAEDELRDANWMLKIYESPKSESDQRERKRYERKRKFYQHRIEQIHEEYDFEEYDGNPF